jgi:hypothetical protein
MNSIVSEKRFISERLGVPYENLSQSYLRSETLLTTQAVIDFVLQTNKKTIPLVTERLLDLNDEFVITHYTIGLKSIASATPTDLQQLIAPVLTYNNATAFTANGANVAAIYNSDLSFTIDRKEFVPQFPVRAFRRVPTTQQAANADYTTSGITQLDGFDNGLFAFYPSEPTKIDGRQTIDLAINLGSSTTFADASKAYYAVFEARGYLIVNAKS